MMNNFSFGQNQQSGDHPFKSQYQNHWANSQGYYQHKDYNFYDLNNKGNRAGAGGQKYDFSENYFTMYQDKFGNWHVVRNNGKTQESQQTQYQQQAREDPYHKHQRAQQNQRGHDDFTSHYYDNGRQYHSSAFNNPYTGFASGGEKKRYDENIKDIQNLMLKRRIYGITM